MRIHIPKAFFVVFAVLLLGGCATALPPPALADLPGFWSGFLHGMILPYSFIGSLFSDTIAIYSVPNSGDWYDFGFILGVGGFTSSAASVRTWVFLYALVGLRAVMTWVSYLALAGLRAVKQALK